MLPATHPSPRWVDWRRRQAMRPAPPAISAASAAPTPRATGDPKVELARVEVGDTAITLGPGDDPLLPLLSPVEGTTFFVPAEGLVVEMVGEFAPEPWAAPVPVGLEGDDGPLGLGDLAVPADGAAPPAPPTAAGAVAVAKVVAVTGPVGAELSARTAFGAKVG